MGSAPLAVQGVTVRFGGLTALERVSLEVADGEVLGVIGPNGAGKTTLFNCISGFVKPQSGTISWRGQQLERMRSDRRAGKGIARTLQGVGLFSGLTVAENVMVGAQRFRRTGVLSALVALPRAERDERALRARAIRALSAVGCEKVAERRPDSLPFAVQKRVALARALVAEPKLLMLDEPASGLDAAELEQLAALIRSIRGTMSVMVVEHHMDFVMSICDRVAVLDFGRVICIGAPQAVRSDSRVLEAYLGDEAVRRPAGRDA
ncbi:MAG TPA: ABC transporter ATP-binding protein [Solirubrobacteraceae bacterium]|jgi:branched-chain amino acid transport system ATP-binding protein